MSETIKTILTAEARQFHSEFAKATSTINNYQKMVVSVGAALGGSAVLTAVVGKFNAIRNSIDQLNDQAARLELPVEEMQRLNAVATMSGATVETLAKALNKSKLNSLAAAGGNEELAKAFDSLGINASGFFDLGATEQLVAISQGFNSASNQGEAFAAVFKIMGKGAGDLIPLLRDGAAGIEEISRRLQVLGGDDVAAVARMNDEIDLLSANLDTKMKGAFLALRPQIEGFITTLAAAADGLSTFLDPAGGIGKGGGVLGGAQMIGEIDRLTPKIASLKSELSGKSWWEGTADLKIALRESEASVEALKARFGGLTQETQIYAEQLAEFERLKKSGLGEEELRAQVQQMQDATAERIRAIEAEKQIAAAASTAAGEMEKQTVEAGNLANALDNIQVKVEKRIIDAEPPEKRQGVARAGLSGILTREKVGGVGELRQNIGKSTNDADKLRMLQNLDQALDLMQQIKQAGGEIGSRAADQFSTLKSSIQAAADLAIQAREDGSKLVDAASAAAGQAVARRGFSAETQALRLELSGRKELADAIRAEVAYRGEALSLSAQLGITEEEALKQLRERGELEKEIRKNQEGTSGNKDISNPDGGSRPRRGRGRTSGAGLHNPGAVSHTGGKIVDLAGGSQLKLGGGSPLQLGAGRRLERPAIARRVTDGVRDSIVDKRGAVRAAAGQGNSGAMLKELNRVANGQEKLAELFKKIGIF